LSRLPDDPTDRLHVIAHAWAAETATYLRLLVEEEDVTVAVAEPGALVAMKLQSVMNRGRAKEATDLLDIIELTLPLSPGLSARAALSVASAQLRTDAAFHADLWFRARADRTLRLVQGLPEGSHISADDVELVGELLVRTLTGPTKDNQHAQMRSVAKGQR